MDVFEAIAEGLHDEDLDALMTAVKARQAAIPLAVGDTIVVNEQCSPKYMQGVKGKIVKKTTKKSHGHPVYLVKVLESETWKLTGTKMVRYVGGEYKLLDINMPRNLIAKVND